MLKYQDTTARIWLSCDFATSKDSDIGCMGISGAVVIIFQSFAEFEDQWGVLLVLASSELYYSITQMRVDLAFILTYLHVPLLPSLPRNKRSPLLPSIMQLDMMAFPILLSSLRKRGTPPPK